MNAWTIYALLSAVFAALTAVLAKVGIKDVDSNLGTAVRTLVILCVSWGLVAAQGTYRLLPTLSARTLVFLGLSGLATGASWLCYFHALKLGPASRVAPLDKLSVPLTVLLAFCFLHEPVTWKAWAGVALMTGGALMLLQAR